MCCLATAWLDVSIQTNKPTDRQEREILKESWCGADNEDSPVNNETLYEFDL